MTGVQTCALPIFSNDFDAEGYEARLTANLTRQWRLVVNYSYTDSGRVGLAQGRSTGTGCGRRTPWSWSRG